MPYFGHRIRILSEYAGSCMPKMATCHFCFWIPHPSVVGCTRAQRSHTVYGIELRDIPNSLLENIFAETPELERAIPNTDTTLIECEDDSGTLTLFLPAIMLTGPDVESAAVSSNHDSIHFQPPT